MLKFISILLLATSVAGNPTNDLESSKSDDHRIIGGVLASITEIKYIVSLQVDNRHYCGGSIVTRLWILTAAHCTTLARTRYQIRAGSARHNSGGQIRKVAAIRNHPNYNRQTNDYDAALLKLNSNLIINANVGCIRLATPTFAVPTSAKVVVSGWGLTRDGVASSGSIDLRKVLLTVISNQQCSTRWRITQNMICALDAGKDSCQGDSGGPMVYQGTHVGIVSFGAECASPIYPGVYTRTSSIRNFVVNNVGALTC